MKKIKKVSFYEIAMIAKIEDGTVHEIVLNHEQLITLQETLSKLGDVNVLEEELKGITLIPQNE